jgi:hypothetical protein
VCCMTGEKRGRETWLPQRLFSSRLRFSKIRDTVGSSTNPMSGDSFEIWCWRDNCFYFLSSQGTASIPPISLRFYFWMVIRCCCVDWDGQDVQIGLGGVEISRSSFRSPKYFSFLMLVCWDCRIGDGLGSTKTAQWP